MNISDLGFDLIDLRVQTKEAVSAVCTGLGAWSDEVKKKEVLDEAEADIIKTNIRRLERLMDLLPQGNRDTSRDLKQVSDIQKQLGYLGASFS